MRRACLVAVALLLVGGAVVLARDATSDNGHQVSRTDLITEPGADVVGPDVTGRAVPLDSFPALGGGTRSLAAYAGRPLVVNVFSESCAPCRKEMPDLERAHRALGDRVAFLGIAVYDGERDARSIVDRTAVTYDIGRDPDGILVSALGALTIPTTVLVSPDGRIVDVHLGATTEHGLLGSVADHLGVTSR